MTSLVPCRPNILGSSLLHISPSRPPICVLFSEQEIPREFLLLLCTMNPWIYMTNKACDQYQGFFSVHLLTQGINEIDSQSLHDVGVSSLKCFYCTQSY